MNQTRPRYLQLAAEIRQMIGNEINVGDLLPTEHELCKRYRVSRHTARAALQILQDAGLIERRPGLGTRVIATGAPARFTQALGGLEGLLQYAHETTLRLTSTELMRLSGEEARRLDAPDDSDWLRLEGVRHSSDGKLIAAVTVYVDAALGIGPEAFNQPTFAVTEQINALCGVETAKVRQSIRAQMMSPEDADILGLAAGGPILRTLRWYLDDGGRIFTISDSRHPGDRFAYDATFQRGPGT